MKRTILMALMLSLAVGATADELDDVRAKVTERFPQIRPENINAGPVDGLLEIRQGTIIAYLTTDGRYLFQGDLIDLDSDVNLTEQAQSAGRKAMMSAVPPVNQVVFGPSEPKYSVAVFTDVD
ncbi:MAG: disulfide isomerase DsbC N-terminal domain-containing protein, partial [Pseudomonadota bacterium]